MSNRTKSSLSKKRVFFTVLLTILIPICAFLLDRYVDFYEVSLMFCLTIGGSLLIVYDWNLFAVHYNRSKKAPGDTLLYTVIGAILLAAWTFVGIRFLRCDTMIPSGTTLIRNGYARPGMYVAYSFMLASVISISFKAITDHLAVRSREIQAILITAVTCGLFFTVIFITGFAPLLWIRNCLFNLVTMAILSYLYNQSGSFMPGLLAYTIVHLVIMIVSTL